MKISILSYLSFILAFISCIPSNKITIDRKLDVEVATFFSCQGSTPLNATICDNDNSDLTMNISNTIVTSCTSSAKCEFTCSSGYTLSSNLCESTSASDLSWQNILENNFDIAETFDKLQDWRGQNNLRGYDFNKAHMPIKLDGSASMWDMYDDWSNGDPADDWIKNHGTKNVWNGIGKSLRIDLSQDISAPKDGPSRFGLYFGSNTPGIANAYATKGLSNSGLNDIYYFFMVKLPYNMFPTTNGDIWPNDDYHWWSYYKFTTMSTAFTDIEHINGAAERRDTGCRWEYGCGFYLMNWTQCGSKCEGTDVNTFTQSGLNYVADYFGSYYTPLYRKEGLKTSEAGTFFNQQSAQGKWFGLEYHLTRGTPGKQDGTVEIWAYDEKGNVQHVFSNNTLIFAQAGTNFSFNKFFWGGNLSFQKEVITQNLDTTYYVDDFIINKKRIGPDYFKLIIK